ncbi:MAG: hypothetical protein ABI852_12870 [Gemmatimonadaceae bacterium]
MITPVLIGAMVALSTILLSHVSGFERRTFYTAITLATASYYCLFAVMSGEMRVLTGESMIALFFVLLAVLGFKRNISLVAVALLLHALLDATHGALIANTGTPAFWPPFCLSFDVTAAALLFWQIRRSQVDRYARSSS